MLLNGQRAVPSRLLELGYAFRHPEAGPLLQQLESWLHRPGPADRVDVAGLLKPYQDVPAEAVETGARAC